MFVEAKKCLAAFHDGLVGLLITIEGNLVTQSATFLDGGLPCAHFHEVLRLHLQFLLHKVTEVVGRQDDGGLSQCAFSIDVCFAELFLSDGDTGLLVSVPDDVSPMAASGVERAAVVEDQSIYWTLPLPLPVKEGGGYFCRWFHFSHILEFLISNPSSFITIYSPPL